MKLCPEITKTQNVRMLDVFLFGPFLLYIVFKKEPLTKLEKVLLGTLGAGMMYYNGIRYLANLKLQSYESSSVPSV